MAGKYLGDEFDIHGGGIDLRFPHHENELAQSAAAGKPFARYWMHNAWVTAAGEKMSKSLGNGALVSEVTKRYPPRAVRFYLAAPHYRSAIEFSADSLAEATAARPGSTASSLGPWTPWRRPGHRAGHVHRRDGRRPGYTGGGCRALCGGPRGQHRAGGRRSRRREKSARSRPRDARRARTGSVRDPVWRRLGSQDERLGEVVDGLVSELLEQRAAARVRKDYAAADAIRVARPARGRDRRHPAGPEVVPTDPPSRSLRDNDMAGNSQRKGAVRKSGKGNTAGSGGRVRRGLEGKGPTPKAEDRPYHAATGPRRAPKARPFATSTGRGGHGRTGRPGAGPEWVAGRNPVLEALSASVPIKTAYIAEGAERDDRLRDILKLAADAHIPLLEVTRVELDRLTDGAIHQGVALQLKDYEYVHPDDLLASAIAADGEPLIVALDSVTDPRNLGAIIRSAAAFGAAGVLIPERRSAGMTAAAWKTSAGAAARLPVARATNLTRTLKAYADAGLFLVGARRS